MEQTEILSFDNNEYCRTLFGLHNTHLQVIARHYDIQVDSRGNEITLRGESDNVKQALKVLNQLYTLVERRYPLSESDIHQAFEILEQHPDSQLERVFLDKAIISGTGRKRITPKSPAQKAYVDAIERLDLVFSVGPAGTGKTYLAMAMAVAALLRKDYKRIILTRPAVEAGEHLGFLPGDLIEKVNPYLRPLYDALYDMIDIEKARVWMQQGTVEVAPLAFMRGRTLNDSFIILDEAQNTTPEQMKMFLTRIGFGSKAVVTGDITQIDLPNNTHSGLVHAVGILKDVEGIATCRFTHRDVVRHPLVKRIVLAYDNYDRGKDVQQNKSK